MSPHTVERRTASRTELKRDALVQASVLVSEDDRFEIPCTLRDISRSGALVECEDLNEELYLELHARLRHGGVTLPCRLIRLDRTRVGVRFLGEPLLIAAFVDSLLGAAA
ncbi:MAG: PilZ domain-containing protein [Myxococcales bacterium]|nr:PilZ domain-containing protein [Myxococcales bacterium]